MTLPRPPYDPELGAFLEAQYGASPEPAAALSSGTLPGVREMLASISPSIDATIAGSGLEHVELTVTEEPEIALSVIRRPGVTTPAPCVYYVHGGGMIMGDRQTGAPIFSRWAGTFGVTVVSVEYRLAPEHPDPAPVSDCCAGLRWATGRAAELGIDPARIVIAGNSADGGLAAATALMARDNGGPALIGQLAAETRVARAALAAQRQLAGSHPGRVTHEAMGMKDPGATNSTSIDAGVDSLGEPVDKFSGIVAGGCRSGGRRPAQ